MSIGTIAPYRRRFFGRDARFVSGSLLLDLHRQARRMARRKSTEPHKARPVPGA